MNDNNIKIWALYLESWASYEYFGESSLDKISIQSNFENWICPQDFKILTIFSHVIYVWTLFSNKECQTSPLRFFYVWGLSAHLTLKFFSKILHRWE